MTVDTTPTRSRRAVVLGAIGGLGALAASALRPLEARAGVDGDVVLGQGNSETSETGISNNTNSNNVFAARSPAGGIAVLGVSNSNIGVVGTSATGIGVRGFSNNGAGIIGLTASVTAAAILGEATAHTTGVMGFSGTPDPPPAKLKTGVYGFAVQDANSRGVWGTAYAGRGVFGEATSGLGVRGFASSGVGLSGEATTGYALRTKGRVRLDQSAGIATVAAGTATKVVTPGVDLTSTSAVVATLNGDAGGSVAVKRVSINTAANTFTIVLTGNASSSVKVAWVVLG